MKVDDYLSHPPKGESLTYRYWTIPRVNPTWFADRTLGAWLVRYEEFQMWWENLPRRIMEVGHPVAASTRDAVREWLAAPAPRSVEWLRSRVVADPLFNEKATHESMSRAYLARHAHSDDNAIFEFAFHDPQAESTPWVAAQAAAWRDTGDFRRLGRLDTAARSRRGGRTSATELAEVVSRDQRIFEGMIKVVESGGTPKAAVYTAVDGLAVTSSLAKKVYRLYLPLYAVACTLDWPSERLFDDLHVMTDRLGRVFAAPHP